MEIFPLSFARLRGIARFLVLPQSCGSVLVSSCCFLSLTGGLGSMMEELRFFSPSVWIDFPFFFSIMVVFFILFSEFLSVGGFYVLKVPSSKVPWWQLIFYRG